MLLSGYALISVIKTNRMSDDARKQMVYDLYYTYGKKDKPDEMTFVDQFIQGMGVFSVLFDKIPISTTDVEEDSEEFELHLNQIFRQDNSKKNSLLGSTSQKIGLSD
jgi:hypothetical protein